MSSAAAASGKHFAFLINGGDAAPRRARELVSASVNGAYFDTALLDDLLLTVTEVVTNSVKHGAADENEVIELVLAFDRECVRIDVSDNGPGFTPGMASARFGRPGGLGLQLVESLSDRWGVASRAPTRVWVEFLPTPVHPV